MEVCLVIKRRLEELGLDGRSDGCRRGDGVLHCWSRYGKYNDFNVYGLFGRDRNGCKLYSARISALGVIQPDRKGSFASLVEFDLKNILVILEIRVVCKDGPAAS